MANVYQLPASKLGRYELRNYGVASLAIPSPRSTSEIWAGLMPLPILGDNPRRDALVAELRGESA